MSESVWTKYEYGYDVAWQRECEKCDRGGLLLSPARFCPVCHGSGFIVKWQKERPTEPKVKPVAGSRRPT